MTVASTNSKAGPYAGAGTTGPFAVDFRFLEDSHLQVIRTSAAGVATTLTLTTDYTVTGAGGVSGEVTLVAALAVGETLTVLRSVPATQDTDYVQNDAFPAESHERALDKLTMIAQQQSEILSRAITVPTGESSVPSLPAAADRANKLLAFDASGNPTASVPVSGSAADVLLQLSGSSGASYVGFLQSGAGATARTIQAKGRETISVADFAGLAFTHNAKSPGDPNSFFSASFTSWKLAIQAAIDEAFARGGGTVLVNGGPSSVLLVDDYIRVKSNVRLEFESTIKLGDYTTIGGLLIIDGSDIEIVNPRLDGSNIFAGASGENGICPLQGNNIKVLGGEVKNFARGNTGGAFGGKGVQVEGGTSTNVVVDGLSIKTCHMAMSSYFDHGTAAQIGPVLFSNIAAEDCGILLFVRQSNGSDTAGLKHSVTLENFTAKNCGTFEGALQFSRAANVLVSSGLIVNSASINAFIRGNHRFCEFKGLTFSGACTQIINLDPSTYATDASFAIENNKYEFKHTGTAGYVANSSVGTPFRTLQDCQLDFQLQNDVSTKIVGDELRNGYCLVTGQQGAKSFVASAAELFTLSLTKFANFSAGRSVYAQNVGAYSFNAVGSPLSFTDNSGAGLVFTTNSGDWTKIGRMVFMSFNITFPVTANGAGNSIAGLPFPAINNARGTVGVSLRFTDLTVSNVSVSVNSNTSLMAIIGGGAVLANSALSGKTVSGILSYMTA